MHVLVPCDTEGCLEEKCLVYSQKVVARAMAGRLSVVKYVVFIALTRTGQLLL